LFAINDYLFTDLGGISLLLNHRVGDFEAPTDNPIAQMQTLHADRRALGTVDPKRHNTKEEFLAKFQMTRRNIKPCYG
jgi:hypothetical protein